VDDIEASIDGCRRGDRASQQELYARYHPTVFRLAVRMVGSQAAADVMQEVFLRVFQRIASFRGDSEFSTWLCRIAINECLQQRRSQAARLEPLADEPISPAPSPERRLETADLIDWALGLLDDRLRAVFLLREVEGLTYDQIAAVRGIPPGTVASQLNQARTELRRHLKEAFAS
jgi:RNA polymerase sigma-70 factor (ECF subfamily)